MRYITLSLASFIATVTPSFAKKGIQTQVEFIEVPQKLFSKLTFGEAMNQSDSQLRAKLQKLIEKKQATLTETTLISSVVGKNAYSESTFQAIYPTEYDWATIIPKQTNKFGTKTSATHSGILATTFEERPVGNLIDLKTGSYPDSTTLEFQLAAEIVSHQGHFIWEDWKDNFATTNMALPKFYKNSVETTLYVKPGEYHLVSVLSPSKKKSAKVKPLQQGTIDTKRKTFVFLRTTVTPLTNATKVTPLLPITHSSNSQHHILENEWVELSLSDYTDLFFDPSGIPSGTTIRKKLHSLIQSNKAKMIKSTKIVSEPNRELLKSQTTPYNYAEYFDPPSITPEQTDAEGKVTREKYVTNPKPDNELTKQLGYSLSLKHLPNKAPVASQLMQIYSIQSKRLPDSSYGTFVESKDPFTYTTPQFNDQNLWTQLHLVPGKWQIAGTHTPYNKKGERLNGKRIIHLVRTINYPAQP